MNVRFDKDGAIAILTLDRPDKLNAMADEMWDALYQHLGAITQDDAVRAVILTGAGRAFCSGGDVSGMAKSDVISGRARSKMFHAMALPSLERLLETETLASGLVRLTHDHKEGVAAFREKRPPRFLGR